MLPTLRFIHCADLHLDSPFKGIGSGLSSRLSKDVIESTFQAFERIISHALDNKVDFVVMVGDLFDQDGRSLKAQIRLKKGFDTLHKAGIRVFLSHGNHDHTGGSFYPVHFPDNVTIFKEEAVSTIPFYKNGQHVANIQGFSYSRRAVYEEKVIEYERTSEDVYHIGLLHGSIATNTDHDVYAPFRVSQLNEVGHDYWALGHIHKRQVLQEEPPIVYPGNIQGRHHKEEGAKGCYLVDLAETNTTLTFLPTHSVLFQQTTFDVSHIQTLGEFHDEVDKWKDENRQVYGPMIFKMKIEGHLEGDEMKEEAVRNLVDVWNEKEEEEEAWLWLQDIVIHSTPSWDREELKQGSHFVADLIRRIDESDEIDPMLAELTTHKQGRKYVGTFSDEEKKEIVSEAEAYLLKSLLEEERSE
ncbi:DNA repair exonuclease [Pontibacillus sp. ALD_SL1]|uniref:metallophosphoesterase family protein n=1 Tax=Pontibacillus sp. ALD_SL1 TaxID=2777185 RepID=UPI001A963E9E|nr:DNA repair exonuclease [Pontibacillus sp. ALD_SL1]QST00710.1 DNA repair exonuclease [Pontibacillus sp. ALD_SL1]